MAISVRKGTLDDYDDIGRLMRQLDETHIPMRPSFLKHYDGPSRRYEEVRDIVESPHKDYLVAERDGVAVGLASLEVLSMPDHPIFRVNRIALVVELVVDQACRSQGIGKALLDEAKRWAEAHGLTCVQLNVQSANEDAIRFYEREGFEPFLLRMWFNSG